MTLQWPCPMDWGLSEKTRKRDKSKIVIEDVNTYFSKMDKKSRKQIRRIPAFNQPDLCIWPHWENENCEQLQNKHSSNEAMDNLPKSYILGHKVTFKIFQGTEIIQSMFSNHSILSSKTSIKKWGNPQMFGNNVFLRNHKSKKKLQQKLENILSLKIIKI